MIVAPAVAVRAGLRALLSDDPQVQVIAEAASLGELEGAQMDASVVLWSPSPAIVPEAVRLELSNCKIEGFGALLLIHSDPQVIEQLAKLTIRAWGVLDPESTQGELVAGVHALDEGLMVANPVWLKQAFTRRAASANENNGLVDPLTERELEVLQLLANGLTNKQIAARLKISAHTVKFHVSTIFTKLGTSNRVETVNLGMKMGLIAL